MTSVHLSTPKRSPGVRSEGATPIAAILDILTSSDTLFTTVRRVD